MLEFSDDAIVFKLANALRISMDELKLLNLVKDRSLLDITKHTARSFREDIYGLNPQIDESRIRSRRMVREENRAVQGVSARVGLKSKWLLKIAVNWQ